MSTLHVLPGGPARDVCPLGRTVEIKLIKVFIKYDYSQVQETLLQHVTYWLTYENWNKLA